MKFFLIVVFDCQYGIGYDNQLLWQLFDDFKCFKVLIVGKLILMGWCIVELLGCVLLGCCNLVFICIGEVLFEGMQVVELVEQVLQQVCVDGVDELCVIGGGQIYVLVMVQVIDLYLIWVDIVVVVDIYFLFVDLVLWVEVVCEYYLVDVWYVVVFDFVDYCCC